MADDVQEVDDRRVVPAEEILGKIQAGEPVEYDNVIVEGDLDLEGLELPTVPVNRDWYEIEFEGLSEEAKVVKVAVNITGSLINGSLHFNNTILQKSVNFKGTNFARTAEFKGVEFSGGDANFRRAKFNGGNAEFQEAEFSGVIADFGYAEFSEGYAGFNGVKFSGKNTYFGGAKFRGVGAYFVRTEFSGGDADFSYVEFSGEYTEFGLAEFNGKETSFSGAKFSGGIPNFRDSKVNGSIDLTGLQFTRLNIDMDSINKLICNDGPTYLALIKNFRDIEQFDDADDCYYYYRAWRLNNRPFGWSKLCDYVAWLSCGYGVRPSFVLSWFFILITGLALFLWIFNIYQPIVDSFSIADSLYFSIMAVTTTIPSALKLTGSAKYAIMIARVLGALLLSLFVVVLTKKLIR